jgi:hypothetical protein
MAKPIEGKRHEMQMARLVSFCKTDWGQTSQKHHHPIHRSYSTYKKNHFGVSPSGIVYTPLSLPFDWDFGGTYQPQTINKERPQCE